VGGTGGRTGARGRGDGGGGEAARGGRASGDGGARGAGDGGVAAAVGGRRGAGRRGGDATGAGEAAAGGGRGARAAGDGGAGAARAADRQVGRRVRTGRSRARDPRRVGAAAVHGRKEEGRRADRAALARAAHDVRSRARGRRAGGGADEDEPGA